MIVAQNQTESSIYMADESSVIPIGDKILFDEIHKNNTSTSAKLYNVNPGTLYVKVHAGSMEIDLSYKNQSLVYRYESDKHVKK